MEIENQIIYLALRPKHLMCELSINQWNDFITSYENDDNAIDTKSHFEYIAHKIDLDAKGFVDAVEEAIKMKIEVANGKISKKTATKKTEKKEPVPEVEVVEENVDDIDEDIPFDVDLDEDLDTENVTEMRTLIRNKQKTATPEQKKAAKEMIAENGGKLDDIEDPEVLSQILEIYE